MTLSNLFGKMSSIRLAFLSTALLHMLPSGAAASRNQMPEIHPFFERATDDARPAITTNTVRLAAKKKETEKSLDANEVETEDIFGFTFGTDLPERGQKEGEVELFAARGKQDGSYTVLAKELALKYMALTDTRVSVSGVLAYHSISGVTGFDDRHTVSPQSLGFETRHRFVDRAKGPFGVAIRIRPSWARVDEVSGVPVSQFGTDFGLLADQELVKDRLFGAINLRYDFAASRVLNTGEWERESSIGAAVAASWQVRPGLFVGAEARYFRAYEGLALNSFSGEALFVGPTFFTKLSKCCFFAGAWNIQAWGHEQGGSSSRDLVNFERQRATLKVGFEM
jgi:hypothetical protein